MNQNKIFAFAVAGIGILFAVWMIVVALGGGANALSSLYKPLIVILSIAGLLAPKMGIYLLVLLTGYLDLLKRFLILAGDVGFLDLVYILGMAPILLAGVVIGTLLRVVLGYLPGAKKPFILFGVCSVLFGLVCFFTLVSSSSKIDTIKTAANGGAYFYLLFVIPCLFRNSGEIRNLFKFALFTFVPVAAYTFWQSYFGFSGFEMDYLLSGLTIEVRQLNERIARPFSTLNSAHSLSIMLCLLSVAAIGMMGRYHATGSYRGILRFLVAALFFAAAFFTFTRSGWLAGIVGIIGLLAFRNVITTLAVYALGVVLSLFIFLNSEYLLDRLLTSWMFEVAELFGSGDVSIMASRIGTFSDRLRGMRNLLQSPELWQPFGVYLGTGTGTLSAAVTTHDFFTRTLIVVGYVPCTAAVLVFGYLLKVAHSLIYTTQRKTDGRIAMTAISCSLGVGAAAGTNAGGFMIFPVNFYFWLCISTLICVWLYAERRPPLRRKILSDAGAGGRSPATVSGQV